jgi:hypothetical protein
LQRQLPCAACQGLKPFAANLCCDAPCRNHVSLQAIQAGQVTVEDHLMSDLDMQPLLVVGWEGLIGSIVMLGGALPLLQALPYRDGSGFAEDTVGSWCMIRNSAAIAGRLVYNHSLQGLQVQVV